MIQDVSRSADVVNSESILVAQRFSGEVGGPRYSSGQYVYCISPANALPPFPGYRPRPYLLIFAPEPPPPRRTTPAPSPRPIRRPNQWSALSRSVAAQRTFEGACIRKLRSQFPFALVVLKIFSGHQSNHCVAATLLRWMLSSDYF
jgi:hypothetical protein